VDRNVSLTLSTSETNIAQRIPLEKKSVTGARIGGQAVSLMLLGFNTMEGACVIGCESFTAMPFGTVTGVERKRDLSRITQGEEHVVAGLGAGQLR
jgi:hypothetical protein